MNYSYYFVLFIIYSFVGWLIEVILILIQNRKFVNRGFLIGPYLPIYGHGALLITLLLQRYLDHPLILFTESIIICAIIEYLTSYLLEKIFNTSWWDYRNNKYNLNGRICLETMIPFGIGSLFLMYIFNPFINNILSIVPNNIINILAIILLIIYVIDVIISFRIIWKFKGISKDAKKDNTEKVTEFVKKEIYKGKKLLYTRLINAFPNLKVLKKGKKK